MGDKEKEDPSVILESVKVITELAKLPFVKALSVAFIKKLTSSKSWKGEICHFTAKISASEKEYLSLLRFAIEEKIQSFEYTPRSISAFSTIFQELIDNALSHGCKKSHDYVQFTVVISKVFTSISVSNSKNIPFPRNFIKTILDRKKLLLGDEVQSLVGGRGAVMAYDLSDSLTMVNETTIKAVIYRESLEENHVHFEDMTGGDIAVVRILSGLHLERFAECLGDRLIPYRDSPRTFVVVDFRPWESRHSSQECEISTEVADFQTPTPKRKNRREGDERIGSSSKSIKRGISTKEDFETGQKNIFLYGIPKHRICILTGSSVLARYFPQSLITNDVKAIALRAYWNRHVYYNDLDTDIDNGSIVIAGQIGDPDHLLTTTASIKEIKEGSLIGERLKFIDKGTQNVRFDRDQFSS